MKPKLLIVAIVLAFITLYFIVDSYAIFESDVLVETKSNLAAWKIKVNKDMITNQVNHFIVDKVNWKTSPNVLEGKAAPGLQADFDIIIDPTGTDVSIKYDITLDFDSINNEEFKLVSIKETSGSKLIRTGKYNYTVVLLLEEIKKGIVNDIKVNMIWDNNEANNEVDSQFSKTPNATIQLPVSIHFSQYFGEEIIEYIE